MNALHADSVVSQMWCGNRWRACTHEHQVMAIQISLDRFNEEVFKNYNSLFLLLYIFTCFLVYFCTNYLEINQWQNFANFIEFSVCFFSFPPFEHWWSFRFETSDKNCSEFCFSGKNQFLVKKFKWPLY